MPVLPPQRAQNARRGPLLADNALLDLPRFEELFPASVTITRTSETDFKSRPLIVTIEGRRVATLLWGDSVTCDLLGFVTDEMQSGDDVTERVVDIDTRLANGRNTEKRLGEVLRNRTGDVSDVLAVEREIARVREEIEKLDADRTNLERRVTYATVTLNVTEARQARSRSDRCRSRRALAMPPWTACAPLSTARPARCSWRCARPRRCCSGWRFSGGPRAGCYV